MKYYDPKKNSHFEFLPCLESDANTNSGDFYLAASESSYATLKVKKINYAHCNIAKKWFSKKIRIERAQLFIFSPFKNDFTYQNNDLI